MALNKIKCVGTHLMKEEKDLHNENFKSLKKETYDDERWKNIPWSWIYTINLKKCLF
jgi:hypothetical protein